MRSVTLLLISCACAVISFAEEAPSPAPAQPEKTVAAVPEAQWYGAAVARMNEPRLGDPPIDAAAKIYRFTVLPSWGNAISVRAEKQKDSYRLSARRLDGQGGNHLGKLVEQQEVQLSKGDSEKLDALLKELNFFATPTKDASDGRDSTGWILEGVSDGKYHYVSRWSTTSEDLEAKGLKEFVSVCRFLIEKSSLSERPKNRGRDLFPELKPAS